MSFFESFPEPPPRPRGPMVRSPWEPSDRVVPGSVAGELLLARTEAVAVAVGSLRAHPNGLQFTVHVRSRREDPDSRGLRDPFNSHGPRRDEGGRLRLGVLFADGRRTVTDAGWGHGRDYSETGEPLIRSEGSSGSARRWDANFWLYPLPPDGPLTFLVSWTAHGITEAEGEVDASLIRAAAGRAVQLWPEDPDEEPAPGSVSSPLTSQGDG